MNDHSVTPRDDGPGGSHRSGRLIRGIRIGWNSGWSGLVELKPEQSSVPHAPDRRREGGALPKLRNSKACR